jgi:hypothetical protein
MPSLAIAALPGLRPAAALAVRPAGHPCPRRSSGRLLHRSKAIPGHCCLAGPPPAGRTSRRPFHARLAVWMAGWFLFPQSPGSRPGLLWRIKAPGASRGTVRCGREIIVVGNPGRGRGCPCQSRRRWKPKRRQDAEARFPSSDRSTGCAQGASGEMARATPTHAGRSFRAGRKGTVPGTGNSDPRKGLRRVTRSGASCKRMRSPARTSCPRDA